MAQNESVLEMRAERMSYEENRERSVAHWGSLAQFKYTYKKLKADGQHSSYEKHQLKPHLRLNKLLTLWKIYAIDDSLASEIELSPGN